MTKLLGKAGRGAFPPNVVVAIKALACELPHELGIPLSRFSMSELKRVAVARGIVASIGETTIWRWLSEDAIKPWHQRSWVFSRDPDFEAKAGRILDLYEGVWEGRVLRDNDWVICADEKTSIQARQRCHPTLPPAPGRAMRVEHEYQRQGAVVYLAAWDVRRARVFGRFEATTGIEPFNRLVQQVMSQEPYCSAPRVFWVVDNGSSHRGKACIRRLQARWNNLVPVHTPVHARLAQPDRDLLLDPPKEGPHSQRLRLHGDGRGPRPALPASLRRGRPTLQMEVHARRQLRELMDRLERHESPARRAA